MPGVHRAQKQDGKPMIDHLTDVSDNALAQLGGINIVVSDLLPIQPTFHQNIERQVRHGLADVLAYLGQDPGPQPGEPTQALLIAGQLYTSRPIAERIRAVRRAQMVMHLSQEANTAGWDFTANIDGQTVFERQADVDYRNQPPQPEPPAINGRP